MNRRVVLPDLAQLYAAVRLAGESHLVYFAQAPGAAFPTPFLKCSDVFSPAGDEEPIPWDLIREVKTIYETGGDSALIGWVSDQRKKKEVKC